MVQPSHAVTAAALSLLIANVAFAQTYRDAGGTVAPGVVPVGGDGSGPLFTSGNPGYVSGSFSASFSGFQPTPSYSAQSVTTASASYALPAGAVVVVYNTGANAITVKLGASGVGVTAGQADVVQPNSWMAFTVGSATRYAVVGNGGPSTVVVSGGSGLPAGAGGGGGGGSGGTVAQGSQGSASSAWFDQIVQGGSAVAAGNGLYVQPGTGATFPVTGTFWQTTQPVSLASVPALSSGSNVIGGVTQASGPWTVSWSGQSVGVSSLPALSSGSAVIGKVDLLGASGAALDSAAGTANGQALTIQGAASGIAVPVSAASLPLALGAATAANQPTVAAQASTTSSQTGTLGMAAAVSAAPSNAAAQTYPLTEDLAGDLRAVLPTVTGAGGTGGTAAGSSVLLGAQCCGGLSLTSGQQAPIQMTGTGALYASLANSTSVIGKVNVLGTGSALLDSAIGGATAAANDVQVGGVYSPGLSLTAGQAAALQLDASGSLRDDLMSVGGASVATGAGASNSGTLRVVTSSDSPNAPFSYISTGYLVRSANATPYTANTGWNNSSAATTFTFANACRVNGGYVLIPEIDIYSSANPTTKLSGVLWLFSASIGSVIADAAAFTILPADFANVTGPMQGIGFSLGNSQASGASNSATALTGTTWHARCASGSTSISGMVEVTNAYTPASGETLTVELHTVGVN